MSTGLSDGKSSAQTPPNQHGWLFRLTHSRPRPRRGYHRSRQERQFDLSAMPDFESANSAVFLMVSVSVVVIAMLWWRLLA